MVKNAHHNFPTTQRHNIYKELALSYQQSKDCNYLIHNNTNQRRDDDNHISY